MSRTICMILGLVVLVSGAAILAQNPPQINVPYRCANGITYTVLNCKPYRADQWCRTTEEQNGNLMTTFDSAWSSMTGRLQGCTTAAVAAHQAAPAVAASGPISGAPQLGVYHCTNGFILTISKCDKLGGVDACWFKIENKGQVLADSPGSVSGAVKMVRACNRDMSAVPGASPAKSGSPRAMDPAYLADMPSVDRVKSEIKGSDAIDTMARQVAVFTYLGEYVKRIKDTRSMRSPYTPDEQNVMSAYSMASYQITQDYAKSHTPAEASAFQSMHWKYEMGDADKCATQLMGKQSTDAYRGALKDLSATGKKHYDEEMRTYNDAVAKQKEAANNPGGADDHYAKDAGSVAARHCLESGRSEMECVGEGMKVGFNDLMGGDIQEAIVGKIPTGLRLTGVYSSPGFSLNFRQDLVYVFCGTLNPEPRTYTVDRSGMQVSVTIPVTNPPLILSYKADGSLSGQGRTIAVAGEVPAGGGGGSTTYDTHTTTATTQRQLEPGEEREYSADQLHQNGGQFSVDQLTTSSSSTPTFHRAPTVPKTERCTVGTLPATSETFKTAALLTQVLGSKASKSANSAPGLRLNGKYEVPGGLKIEFRDDSATLECGESFNSEAYEVERENGQMIVKFQNNTGPLSLVLQPNNTLTGSGVIDVTGRKAIQAAGGGVGYTPRNARCSLGTMEAAK
jgi:hypothetical protein